MITADEILKKFNADPMDYQKWYDFTTSRIEQLVDASQETLSKHNQVSFSYNLLTWMEEDKPSNYEKMMRKYSGKIIQFLADHGFSAEHIGGDTNIIRIKIPVKRSMVEEITQDIVQTSTISGTKGLNIIPGWVPPLTLKTHWDHDRFPDWTTKKDDAE